MDFIFFGDEFSGTEQVVVAFSGELTQEVSLHGDSMALATTQGFKAEVVSLISMRNPSERGKWLTLPIA